MAAKEMEEAMYSPKLSEETVHKLWELKQVCKKPMTKLAEELIQRGLEGFVREAEWHFSIKESHAANVIQEVRNEQPGS